MTPKRVALKSIKSLTFHQGQETVGRRTDPIPQLQCHGKACRRFQPEVVQCQNTGDDGSGSVQWKCDADLPEGMRFGKIDVSCEGWTRAGDTNVLQGSCGLSYDLITIDKGLERGEYDYPSRSSMSSGNDLLSSITQMIALLTTVWVLYNLFKGIGGTLWKRFFGPAHPEGGGGGGGGGDGGGGGGPGFNGGGGGPPPPPPYTKNDTPTPSYPPGALSPAQAQAQGGLGGFWTGLAAGGAATYFLNRDRRDDTTGPGLRERRGPRVDWEDANDWPRDDRGPGPSRGGGGGEMRRATGFGSSSTR